MAINPFVNKVVYGSTTIIDISDTTAVASDVATGKYFYLSTGQKVEGTASGGGGGAITINDVPNASGTTAQITNDLGTKHVIHLEFSDSTDTDIDLYYDDALLGTMISAYRPSGTWTYNSKTVVEAQLDGTTFYEASVIPIGVQLIDYSECEYNKALNSSGAEITQEWYYLSDFTPVETSMNFSYRAGYWTYIGFYNESQTALATVAVYNHGTQDPNDNNTGYGSITGTNLPAGTKYIRLSGTSDDSNHISLIRTA